MRRPQLGMALRLWRRNMRVFAKLWRGALLPPFVDPVFYLIGLGFGLGAYVASVNGIPYRDFVAPGLCASAVLWSATFEVTFAFFWRMDMLRTHDNVLTTPVEAEDVVLGELLWAATKATIYGTTYLVVITVLGFVDSPWAIAMPLFLFVGGLAFAAMGMTYSVLNRRIDYFTYYFTFVVNPLFLFGGIFFPYDQLPDWAQILAWFAPTLHLVEIARDLSAGTDAVAILGHALWLVVAAALLAIVPMLRLRRRLVA